MEITDTNLNFGPLQQRTKTERIVVHHVGEINREVSAAEIHEWHKERGWSGIGYHFVIHKDGTIERGRPVDAVGSHAQGYNATSIGINVVGDFRYNEPTPEQQKALTELLTDLSKKYALEPDRNTIVGHRDLNSTDCPGDKLYNKLDDIVKGVSIQLNNQTMSPNIGATPPVSSIGEQRAYENQAAKEAEREMWRNLKGEQSIEAQQRLQAIQNVEPRPNIAGVEKLLINEVREYRIQAKAIIDREGQWTGQGADMEIAKKMCVMGYSQLHVTRALMNASIETADRTTEQAKQYGQEIYAQVMTPELQQSLSHRGHGLR